MNFISPPQLEPDNLRVSGPSEMDADVLVIGSGAGGSVIAATAAELGHSVLMLEEGPYVPTQRAPARLTEAQATLWRHGGLTTAYGTPSISYTEACCVGGSTEVNNAVFERVPSVLLAEWQTRYDIRDFGTLAMAPYYEWAAHIVNASRTKGSMGTPNDILAEAGNIMGWETKMLERGQHHCVGNNMCTQSCPTGAKQSMSTTLIPQLLSESHRVIAEAKVTKVTMRGPWVNFVEARAKGADGRTHNLRINARKVFLCAGAIQTPALLQKAGFRGVVGHNLRLQPTLGCLALFNQIIDSQNYSQPLATITEFMPDIQIGGTPFTPALYGQMIGQDWQNRADYIHHLRQAASYQVILRGQGSGRVRAMPGGAAPVVTYKLDRQDWHKLGTGMQKLGEALLRAGAGIVLPSINGHEGWRAPHEANEDDVRAMPHKHARITSAHLSSSCAMGENPNLCAVDSFGRVHGASNLYVADASIIPEAPGVSAQATVMALARRNALHVLDRVS